MWGVPFRLVAASQGEIYGGNQQLDWMIEDVDFGD